MTHAIRQIVQLLSDKIASKHVCHQIIFSGTHHLSHKGTTRHLTENARVTLSFVSKWDFALLYIPVFVNITMVLTKLKSINQSIIDHLPKFTIQVVTHLKIQLTLKLCRIMGDDCTFHWIVATNVKLEKKFALDILALWIVVIKFKKELVLM